MTRLLLHPDWIKLVLYCLITPWIGRILGWTSFYLKGYYLSLILPLKNTQPPPLSPVQRLLFNPIKDLPWCWVPLLGTWLYRHHSYFPSVRRMLSFELGTICLGLIALPCLDAGSYVAFTGLLWVLLILAVLDHDHLIAPNALTFPLLFTGVVFHFIRHTPLISPTTGILFGYLLLWLPMQGYRLLSQRRGLGLGDCKLFAALGAWLGWQVLPMILLIASLTAVLTHRVLPRFRRAHPQAPAGYIPLVPYLAWATGIILVSALYFQHPQLLLLNGI